MSSLDAVFAPRSVAILGVSRNPAKLGFQLLQNVTKSGYDGAVYPVNPSGESILGLPTTRSVEGLPEGLDLALVSLPAVAVPDAVRRLGARRARAAVVLSSGFGEVDDAGRGTEAELRAIASASGLRLVGPNCMGVYSGPARLNGTYFWDLPILPGGIAVVSQSGAYGGLIFRHLGSRRLGVARFLSIGNQIDVEIAEVIEYLAADRATTLIACFVEALRDGRRFVEIAQRTVRAKPIVVLKGGRSSAGRRAAGSHTGSLAGADDIYRAAFDGAGVVVADETEEFFDAIEALVVAGARRPASPAVAVITVSGGPSVMAADAAERSGLAVPPLAALVREQLRALLPPFAAVGNPVDLTPQVDRERIGAAVQVTLADASVAGAVAIDVGLDIPEFADAVIGASNVTGKPVVAFTADAPKIAERFNASGVPTLPSPERAVRAWRALWLARPRPARRTIPDQPLADDISRALAEAAGALPYRLARRVLEAVGIRFCREAIVASPDAAGDAADRLGYPVVVKADVEGLLHKTEAGAVRLDLMTRSAVVDACTTLRARLGAPRFIVQERVGPGAELLIGGKRDDTFGPVVVVGLGGILTEVVRDVSVRLAPVDRDDAEAMLREGVRERLLAGPRGLPRPRDAALTDAIVGVGRLMLAAPRVMEVDVNPLVVSAGSAFAVDAVVIVADRVTERRR
jgi:acetate---CoA ligase (ADP-forming)